MTTAAHEPIDRSSRAARPRSPRWLLLAALLWGCGGGTAQQPEASHDQAADHGDHHGHHGHHGHPGHHGDDPHPHGDHHDFSDAERFAEIFDAPDRDEWQRPEEVVELLGVEPGMVVADLGAGTGYFLPHLSRAVGPDGLVIALDVEPAMVEHMCERVAREGLENVDVRRVAPDDPELPDGRVDRVLVVDTWHHIGDRATYSGRLRGALSADSTSGGAVLVVDFTRESEHGPPPEMRLTAEEVADDLRGGGLHPRILEEELPNQYAVLGERAPAARTEARSAEPMPRRSDCAE